MDKYLLEIREAMAIDIPAMHAIRMSVKENALTNPLLVTEKDYWEYLFDKGKGWVCESNDGILGFAILDTVECNVWALFVKPGFEKNGIGRKLHDHMLDWFFHLHHQTIWLGTAPGTRAETFYKAAGWKDCGTRPNGEKRFEMTTSQWKRHTAANQ